MKKERVISPVAEITAIFKNHKTETINVPFKYSIEEEHVGIVIDRFTGDSNVEMVEVNQGFATTERRFVSPEEALKITGWGNQLRFRGITELTVEEFYRY